MPKDQRASAVGIPWYTPQSYERIRQLMLDGHDFPLTHGEWLLTAEKVVENCKRRGTVPVRANIEPQPFAEWCKSRGMPIDRRARVAFANAVAAASYQHGTG
jgi:hypothetical protein